LDQNDKENSYIEIPKNMGYKKEIKNLKRKIQRRDAKLSQFSKIIDSFENSLQSSEIEILKELYNSVPSKIY
jgi:hypothetical protein